MSVHIKRVKMLIVILTAVFIATGGSPFAASLFDGEGQMTSVENDDSIVIDGNGYLADQQILVKDSNGKKISLYRLSLPAKVYFQYEYTKKGPVIKLLKEIPKEIPQ